MTGWIGPAGYRRFAEQGAFKYPRGRVQTRTLYAIFEGIMESDLTR